jgi:hypothetical protein
MERGRLTENASWPPAPGRAVAAPGTGEESRLGRGLDAGNWNVRTGGEGRRLLAAWEVEGPMDDGTWPAGEAARRRENKRRSGVGRRVVRFRVWLLGRLGKWPNGWVPLPAGSRFRSVRSVGRWWPLDGGARRTVGRIGVLGFLSLVGFSVSWVV